MAILLTTAKKIEITFINTQSVLTVTHILKHLTQSSVMYLLLHLIWSWYQSTAIASDLQCLKQKHIILLFPFSFSQQINTKS